MNLDNVMIAEDSDGESIPLLADFGATAKLDDSEVLNVSFLYLPSP